MFILKAGSVAILKQQEMYSIGNAVAQVVSNWLFIVEVQVNFQGNKHIICDG
jgi:hypothetical protein